MQIESARDQMIKQQVRAWDVLDQRVLDVMRDIPRERFVPPRYRGLAFADTSIPLAHGECMLSPKVVGRLLQALEVTAGDRALEIGTGSGFVSACLAEQGAYVRSFEIHADLAAAARQNLAACAAKAVEVVTADAFAVTLPSNNTIIALTGSLPRYDERFQQALAIGGRLFVVVGTDPIMQARLVTRVAESEWRQQVLFETSVPALHNAPRPSQFHF